MAHEQLPNFPFQWFGVKLPYLFFLKKSLEDETK
jgi:hypothetical protein